MRPKPGQHRGEPLLFLQTDLSAEQILLPRERPPGFASASATISTLDDVTEPARALAIGSAGSQIDNHIPD